MFLMALMKAIKKPGKVGYSHDGRKCSGRRRTVRFGSQADNGSYQHDGVKEDYRHDLRMLLHWTNNFPLFLNFRSTKIRAGKF